MFFFCSQNGFGFYSITEIAVIQEWLYNAQNVPRDLHGERERSNVYQKITSQKHLNIQFCVFLLKAI